MTGKDFSLSDLFSVLKKRWIIILIVALLTGTLAALYSIETFVPMYTSTATFYVTPNNGEDYSSEDKTALDYSMKVISSYTQILRTNDFFQKVSDEYAKQYPDEYAQNPLDYKKIKSAMSTSSDSDTTLFKVSVMMSDAKAAYRISQIMVDYVPSYIQDVSGVSDTVHIADTPRQATVQTNSSNTVRNALIGCLAGILVTYLICFFVELLDTRIKNEEDILNTYTVPLIGTIPDFEQENARR